MDLQAFCSRTCVLAFAWILFGAPAHAHSFQAHSFDNVRVLSNDEIIAATGRSVTEWGNAWWTWAFEHPEIRCARKIINDNAIKNIRNVFVSIDGRPVRDLASHLVKVDRSNPQVFVVDAGPIDADGYGGNLPALQGGYWLMLAPLPPGPHYIVFGATVPDIDPSTGEPTGGTVELYTQLTLRSVAPQHHPHHK